MAVTDQPEPEVVVTPAQLAELEQDLHGVPPHVVLAQGIAAVLPTSGAQVDDTGFSDGIL